MKTRFYLTLVLVISAFALNAQDLQLYDLWAYDKNNTGFISLSDIYRLNDHPDSLAIPDIEGREFDSVQTIRLDGAYRKRFLAGTGLSEKDRVFIYDYARNTLVSKRVKTLNVVAKLNIYASAGDQPFTQGDYMIGFEVNTSSLVGLGDNFSNTLVYVGKRNPFVQEQLKQIVWEKLSAKDIPLELTIKKDTQYFKTNEYITGDCYQYSTEGLQYCIQDLIKGEWNFAKRLLVVDTETNRTVYETTYYAGESASFAPPDHQWTGKLFKNKPIVIFGFQWHSFGCPSIAFVDPSLKDVPINCDNRH